jgi:hypothetical protein
MLGGHDLFLRIGAGLRSASPDGDDTRCYRLAGSRRHTDASSVFEDFSFFGGDRRGPAICGLLAPSYLEFIVGQGLLKDYGRRTARLLDQMEKPLMGRLVDANHCC